MANLGDQGNIAGENRFPLRVKAALGVAAAAVYSESAFAATSASSAAGSKTLTFTAVPSWVAAGGGVANLTTPASIAAGTIITGVTATTVTLSIGVVAAQAVGNGDIISFTQHAARASFASRITSGNYNILDICFAVLGNTTISAESVWPGTADHSIPDADIQFAVNGLWNVFSNA